MVDLHISVMKLVDIKVLVLKMFILDTIQERLHTYQVTRQVLTPLMVGVVLTLLLVIKLRCMVVDTMLLLVMKH